VSGDKTLLHRVQVARLPIIYARIALATSGGYEQQGDALVQTGGTDVTALAEQFKTIAQAEGLTRVREGGPQASMDAWLEALPKGTKQLGIRTLRNPQLEVSVLPEAGGRIWRIKHLATGRDLLRVAGEPGAFEPLDGGYEEYSESGHRSPGFGEAYTVAEADATSITLVGRFRNGLGITRKLRLDAEKPALQIISTLTNGSDAVKTGCLRVHPEFSVADTQRAEVRVRKTDGTWKTYELANPADPKAEKELWLAGDDVPAGRWAVVDLAADLALLDRVPREQLDKCLLNWNGAKSRVNLELFSPEAKLAPGQTLTIEQSYEVISPAQVAGE